MIKTVFCVTQNIASRLQCGVSIRFRTFHHSVLSMGRPFKRKEGPPVLHASQRPPEPGLIDFGSLGLKYAMNHPIDIKIQKRVWSPKPDSVPDLPFLVKRTDVGDSLPVYTEIKGGGRTKIVTLLKNCKGDINELLGDLQKVVGSSTHVELRPGKILINGNFHRRLKIWLIGLGF